MDEPDSCVTANETPAVGVGSTSFEMTVAGLALPFKWHVVADAIAAACILMLGHPYLAAFAFVSYCAIDAVHGAIRNRWAKTAARADEDAGFRKLAVLGAARVVVYLTPVTAVAMDGSPA